MENFLHSKTHKGQNCFPEPQVVLGLRAETLRAALVESEEPAKRVKKFCHAQAREGTLENAWLPLFCFPHLCAWRVILTGPTDAKVSDPTMTQP
jgi:hypothetical protein